MIIGPRDKYNYNLQLSYCFFFLTHSQTKRSTPPSPLPPSMQLRSRIDVPEGWWKNSWKWNFGVAACGTVRADISPLKRIRDALFMWERQLESKPRSAMGSGKKASEHNATTRRNARSCVCLGKPSESTLRWPSSGRNTCGHLSYLPRNPPAMDCAVHSVPILEMVVKMSSCMPFRFPWQQKIHQIDVVPLDGSMHCVLLLPNCRNHLTCPVSEDGCWLMDQMQVVIDTESKYAVITCSRICAQVRLTAMYQEM